MKSLFYQSSLKKTVFVPFSKSTLLGQVAVTLNQYLSQFNTNNTPITLLQSTTLTALLNKLKAPVGSNFETIRLTLVNGLQTLINAINTYTLYSNNLQSLQTSTVRASILDNIQNLLDYIALVQSSPLPNTNFTVLPAQILPEYAVYIERYGVPTNGNFDPVLLSNILNEI
jgi:hypothetical protein